MSLIHFYYQKSRVSVFKAGLDSDIIDMNKIDMGLPLVSSFSASDLNPVYEPSTLTSSFEKMSPLVSSDMSEWFSLLHLSMTQMLLCATPKAIASTPSLHCSSSSARTFRHHLTQNQAAKRLLLGRNAQLRFDKSQGKSPMEAHTPFLPSSTPLLQEGLLRHQQPLALMDIPKYNRLLTDCAKLQKLDQLLMEKYQGGHRCLIFCQMTKMIDILEDYMTWKQFTYFRMDGSTPIADRRYMVEDFQKSSRVFAFLLSTRAGGLGVNLIAADTVIFYDIDWNPTQDAQATDRAHRIGQTKPVSVYRLLTHGTVESKILKRAQQKCVVQQSVLSGQKQDYFKPSEIKDFLLDDEEKESLKKKGLIGTKFMKKQKATKEDVQGLKDQQKQDREQAMREKKEERLKLKQKKDLFKTTNNQPRPLFNLSKGGQKPAIFKTTQVTHSQRQ